MSPFLNTRARLARAARHNVKVYRAFDTFKQFRWFTLIFVVLLPVYPSLSVLGTDMSLAHAADYDESTIITAYSDVGDSDSSYLSENGLVSLDFDSKERALEDIPVLTTIAGSEQKEAQKKAPIILQYTILKGDTLAKLSDRYDVSVEAIAWANDMSVKETLKPGSVIKIPPISGVIHRVAKGDTISEIAAHYNVDSSDIVKTNRLKDVASIRVGMELVIPGAVKKTTTSPKKDANINLTVVPTKAPSTAPKVIETNAAGLKDRYTVKYTGQSRGFAAGNCTWYVAQNKTVTWRGNANQWIKNAKAAGAKTGKTPIPGAIVQLSGRGYNRYYGHVAIVADVTDDNIIIKDMNYRGLYEVTIRKIPRDDVTIDGYIYVD